MTLPTFQTASTDLAICELLRIRPIF